MSYFFYTHFTYILRILVACICALCIGYERKNRAKEAGVRTHCMVACGAALIMIVSKYGFADMGSLPDSASVDVSRIAANIVSGIGFLGAGMIFVRRNMVSGLTTAAGIWVTAGIGMAIGAGMYIEGILSTLVVLIIQIFFSRGPLAKSFKIKKLVVYNVKDSRFPEYAEKKLEPYHVMLQDVGIKKFDDGSYEYRLLIEMPSHINEQDIISEFDYCCEITSNN